LILSEISVSLQLIAEGHLSEMATLGQVDKFRLAVIFIPES
jgi:hypothetical protein